MFCINVLKRLKVEGDSNYKHRRAKHNKSIHHKYKGLITLIVTIISYLTSNHKLLKLIGKSILKMFNRICNDKVQNKGLVKSYLRKSINNVKNYLKRIHLFTIILHRHTV